MAYDDKLADRVRTVLKRRRGIRRRKCSEVSLFCTMEICVVA